ncbi:MAG: hypothetical protein QXS03_02605 [Candidatus Micrarchaeaceae archaeon]
MQFMHGARQAKAQAALDFMLSYGIAIILISIALYVILSEGFFNTQLLPTQCLASSGYACSYYAISSNGILTISISQAFASMINITAVACSSTANASGNKPISGNVNLLSYKAAPQFYGSNVMQYGKIAYGGSPITIQVYCYNSNGAVATKSSSSYSGQIWINYTYPNSPGWYNISEVASFTVKYS